MSKKHNTVFTFADKLRELLAEQGDAERMLREIKAEIREAKNLLFAAMKETDTQSFTRGGMTFYIPAPRPAPSTVSIRTKN